MSELPHFFRNMVRESRLDERAFRQAKVWGVESGVVEALYNRMTASWREIENFKAHWRGQRTGTGTEI